MTDAGDYRILHEAALRDYLAGISDLKALIGGEPAAWGITEVGDGNLNLVFIVRSPRTTSQLAAKGAGSTARACALRSDLDQT